jgi:hypothetical protein
MAGAGYKLFNTGDVLTAAQVNTYLQEQVVMVFADAAARTTALSGVLAEGMVSYLKSDDTVYVYNGSAWVSVANTGDITSVVAGTGLSGGGTSGDVTLNLSTPVSATNGGTAQTTYTTGDLLYASASNTLAKRAIGTTGQVLTVSGGVPTWASASAGALVLTGTNDFSASSSVVVTNCFSSTYDYYVLYFDLSAASGGSDWAINLKMRVSGTSASTNYDHNRIYWNSANTVAAGSATGSTSFPFAEGSTTYPTRTAGTIEFIDPGIARATKIFSKYVYRNNANSSSTGSQFFGAHTTATAYDSLEIFPDSPTTITGTVRVYGYAKS